MVKSQLKMINIYCPSNKSAKVKKLENIVELSPHILLVSI